MGRYLGLRRLEAAELIRAPALEIQDLCSGAEQ